MGLAEIANQLYATPLGEFTRARDEQARVARAAGDAELAKQVKGMRKPSAAAWLVNRLAREDRGGIETLCELGAQLRVAQEQFDADRLRSLTGRRRELVRQLAATAAGADQVSDAVRAEVAATLDAAVIDEPAAAAVRSGQLLRALQASGLEPADLDGAVAVPAQLPVPGRPALRAVQTPARKAHHTASGAQRRADEAREKAALAERALVRAEAAVVTAEQDVRTARATAQQIEQHLTDARAQLAAALDTQRQLQAERDAARRERDAARRALHRAELAVAT